MGYRIIYQLQGFRFEPGRGAFYGGSSYFTELTPESDRQTRTWQRNRQFAYRGSLRHLLVAIQQNNLENERFLVYREDPTRPVSPDAIPMLSNEIGNHLKPFDALSAIAPGQVAGERTLNAPLSLSVFYTPVESRLSPYRDARYAFSQLVFPQCNISITPLGVIVAPRGFEARGYLANDRLANALPNDWTLETPVSRSVPTELLAKTPVAALMRPSNRCLDSLRTQWQFWPIQAGPALFLHIDKPLYLTGEWLWLSTYALNRQTHQPDTANTGPAVRVELWSSQQEMVGQQWVAMQLGRGASQLYLPDSLATGLYTLRAYTDADRRSPRPAFERSVLIVRATDKIKAIATEKPAAGLELQALPEGGRMVAGLPARLGIRAVRGDGLGVAAGGQILGADKRVIAQFETNKLGLGSVDIIAAPPVGEVYTIEVIRPGKAQFQLSSSVAEGLMLRTSLSADSALLTLRVSASAGFANRPAYLVAQSRGRVVEAAAFALSGSQADLSWPTTRFPAGLAQVTLYDSTGHPQAERVVFIPERRPAVTVRVVQAVAATLPAQSGFSLTLIDGNPIVLQALLSVAVTNAETVPADTVVADMSAHLLLTGHLRGAVEQPRSYFRDRSAQTYLALENLLLTQGWRGISWQPTATTPLPLSPDITLRGQVMSLKDEPIKGAKLVLTVAGQSQWQAKEAVTDREGRFSISGLVLTDSTQVRAQVSDVSRRALKVKVLFDNTHAAFEPGLRASPLTLIPVALETAVREGQQRQAFQPSLYRQQGARMLNEVVVRSRILDERPESIRQRSLHSQVDQTLILTDEKQQGGTTLYALLGSIPGVSVTMMNNNGAMAYTVRIYSIGPTAGFSNKSTKTITFDQKGSRVVSVTAAFPNPLFLLDGSPIPDDDGRSLLMFTPNEIERVEVLKTSTAAMYGMRGSNGVIAFYTRQGSDARTPTGAVATYKLPGYTVRRDFFVTRYPAVSMPEVAVAQDVLGWFPLAQTDKRGQFNFSLPLPKLPKNVRITVQGVTPSGDPVSASHVVITR